MNSDDEKQVSLNEIENEDFQTIDIDINEPLITIQPKATKDDIKNEQKKDKDKDKEKEKDIKEEKREYFNCLPTTLYLFDKYCFIDEKRTHKMALEFSEIERWQMCVKQCVCLNCYIPAYIFDTITCPIRFWKYVYIDCGFN